MNAAKHRRGIVLGWLVIFEVVCLVAQYILGMVVNLFVQFPSALPNGNAWSWGMSHSSTLYAHVVLGSLIVLLSVVTLGLSIAYRRSVVVTLSILGLLMVVFAWLSGDEFMVQGQQNFSSYRMAIGFIGALIFYAGEAFVLFRRRSAVY